MRPKNLKTITYLLCFFNLYGIIGLFFLNSATPYFKYAAAIAVMIVFISYFVIWYFWQGKNWARILIMVASVIALINIYNLPAYHILSKIVISAEFVLACYLLYWLNTREVKAFFTNDQIPGIVKR